MRRSREDLRRTLFPGSDLEVWGANKENGWCQVPRLMPILLRLARTKELVGTLDCGSVYLELLTRVFSQGLVVVTTPAEHGWLAGYDGQRVERSWTERIDALETAGFIKCKRDSFNNVKYILVRHPLLVWQEAAARLKLKPDDTMNTLATAIIASSKLRAPEASKPKQVAPTALPPIVMPPAAVPPAPAMASTEVPLQK